MTELSFVKEATAARSARTEALTKEIWGYAERAYQETRSASAQGFAVQKSIADMPTAIVATFRAGRGKPVMGFLGEYDALDGLNQHASCTEKRPVAAGTICLAREASRRPSR